MNDEMAISAYIFERVEMNPCQRQPALLQQRLEKIYKIRAEKFLSWRLRGSLGNIFKVRFSFQPNLY